MTRFGKYTLLSTLGRGGMGEVFLAKPPGDDQPVVIKRILPDLSTDDEILNSFLDETRIAARLRHPHLVRIDELGQVDGEWYVRMEYVPGASLSQLVRAMGKARTPLDLDACLAVAAAIGGALAHAHAARDPEGRPLNVVHRDVTPQNILLGRRGEVKLIDFGVALAEQRYQQTRPGTVKGKMAYMSPEQAEGKDVDRRTDLFALGVCLWEMLTGLQLFYGDSPGELYVRLLLCEVPLPSHHRPDVPPEVDALVLRALARDADARFQTAEDLVEAIETVVAQYQLERGAERLGELVRAHFPDAPPPAPAPGSQEELTAPMPAPGGPLTRFDRARPPMAEVMLTPTVLSTQRPRGFSGEEPELIGRAGELADLHQLLGSGRRLITLLGPGGVGKSRLARAVALQQSASFGERIFLADATSARDLEGLCLCVADALGTAQPPGDPVEGIGALLAARRRCLLVLDHLDHLQADAARAVAAWLAAAKQATLLVVSRVTLEVEGEAQYVVAPLRLEASAGTDSDAVSLFMQRAAAANPRRPSSSWDRVAIRELVRRLEGMPLAIELAAAHVAEAPDETLSALLQEDSSAGMTGVHDAFETSWSQLAPEEQAALVRCSVFQGGFTAEAVMELLRPPGSKDTAAALQLLHRLRRRSLVRVTYATTSEHPRFQMYEAIRTRVAGRLPAEEAAARRRHAEFFLRLGERLGDGAERGSAVLDALATERENLVAAWRYWMGQGVEGARRALRVLLALDAFFVVRGPYGAQLSMLDATLERLQSPAERAPGLEARAKVRLSRGRLDAAGEDLEALLANPGDEGTRARAIAYLGVLRSRQGNLGEAQVLFERAQGELRAVGDLRMEGRVFAHLGAIDMDRSQFETSAQLYERALDLHVRAGDRRFEAITLSNLATLHQMRGAWKEAEESLTRSISLHRSLGNRRSEGIALTNLGDLERDRGAVSRAIAQYQRALKVNQEVGNRRFEAICLLNHALLLLERREGTSAAALLDEALSLALALGDSKHVGLAQGARGALRAWRGEPGASEDISTALLTLEAPAFEPFRAAVELYAAEVDLARAVSLERVGRDAEAQASRDAAAAKVALAVAEAPQGSRAARFEHVRMALRVLKALSDPSSTR